jgi:ATP-binding cassette, subfamily B, bacterial
MINTNTLPQKLRAFIWHFIKPYKGWAFAFISLGLLAGFWGPINSVLIKVIINRLPEVEGGNTGVLIWPSVLLVLNFVIFDNVTWRTAGWINRRFQAVVKNDITKALLSRVLNGSHSYFMESFSGQISHQVMNLADNIGLIINRITLDFLRAASLMTMSLLFAYTVNGAFFLTIFVWAILFFGFSLVMSKRVISLADTHAKSEALLSGQVVDCVSNNSTIRIFSRKDFELGRLKSYFEKLVIKFKKKEGFLLGVYCVQGTMIAVMMGLCTFFLAHYYGKGMVSVGDFALILSLVMRLGHMVWFTMGRIDDFNQYVGRCRQGLNALLASEEIKDREGAKDLKVKEGKITFENVHFHYSDSELLFNDKSIEVRPGEKVGLVGFSGGGKTTFVNLILRLFEIKSGKILIDDQDIKTVTQKSLRKKIAFIPQDPLLFHRTLKENILYGNTGASDEQVIAAAIKANAHDFISKLPMKYDSVVGERGIKLSGGQRQRIAIARALLKDAPILILDEATSQLDSVTENSIKESLEELMKGKTTIVIAHRLSTLLNMDRILVFDRGVIKEDGAHKALLGEDGLYKKLWNAQVGGFLPSGDF